MKIEDAIHQKKPFANAHQRAVVNLIYTSHEVMRGLKKVMAPYGITNQQYNVLRILRGAGEPLTTSQIRDRLLDKMADTSRLVDRLAQKNLVVKSGCPNDKRLVDITLSDEGLNLVSSMDQIVKDTNNQLLNLTAKEANQLSLLLDKARG